MVPQVMIEALPLWMHRLVPDDTRVTFEQYRVYDHLVQSAEHLILRAYIASTHSVSYRPFPVGSAVLGIHPYEHVPRVYTGHNMKVSQDARVNCGEAFAIGAARQRGCTHIPMIAVVGNPQSDHGSGKISATLHPCYRCRAEFAALTEVHNDTIIVTATQEAAHLLAEDTPQLPWVDHLVSTGQIREAFQIIEAWGDTAVSLDHLIDDGLVEVMTVQQLLAYHHST